MVYLTAGPLRIIVLETPSLDALKAGKCVVTPDRDVMIAWTPDATWLADQIQASSGETKRIAELIDESKKRPEASARPAHPAKVMINKKGK